MTKAETLSNLKAYLDGDTAIGNIIPLRSVLESAVGYLETPQEMIKGWVVRDLDGPLILGECKPRRVYDNIWVDLGEYMYIDSRLFPDLKYSDEPIEVELIIRPL